MKKQQMLSGYEISIFCRQTAMLLHAGIPPAESMEILIHDIQDKNGKALISSIHQVCSRGDSFYSALQNAEVFPDYVLHMVALGEESGNLDVVLNSLASYYEREEAIAENIKNAVSYPLVMIGMMILVILVMITKVLPIFNQVFLQLGTRMNAFSTGLLYLGNSLNRYSAGLLFALLFVAAVSYLIFRFPTNRKRLLHFLSNFRILKNFREKLAAGRFASGMALAMGSGMDTYQSLELVSRLVDDALMQRKIAHCMEQIREGAGFSEALSSSAIFTGVYTRMIAIGFRAGSADVVMKQIAETYEKETNRTVYSIISILEPTLVIILSLVVGMILLSVILPLMGIMSGIG